MTYTKHCFLLLLLFLPLCVPADSFSQVVQHPLFRELDEALLRGEITSEDALIEKFRLTSHPESRPGDTRPIIKCTVPLHAEYLQVRDQLSLSAVAEIEPMIDRPESSHLNEYRSQDGHFILYYETEGGHAVPAESTIEAGVPDYIYHAAVAADSSYRHQVEQLGFADFLQSEPYEIYFENIGFYGTTTSSGSTSYIIIHNNFEGFPPNTHPDGDVIGALYATVAHEIKHAIQYETNRWEGSAGSTNWIEMDATMMEEIVYPDVNDYYNYIRSDFESSSPNSRSIFGNPGDPTPNSYWHVTWMLYFTEQYEINFWVDVWNQLIEEWDKPFFDAIGQELEDRNLQLDREQLMNMLWHLGSGPAYSSWDFGFDDRENYPNPNISNQIGVAPGETSGFNLQAMAGHFIGASPSNVTLGQPRFTLESDRTGIALGVIGYFRDGSSDIQFVLNPGTKIQELQTTWSWDDLIDITVAVVNTNRSGMADYTLDISSKLPDEDMISQNYPNPFNPTTKIEFAITQPQNVTIEVFDSIGRKVSTLVKKQLNRGFHSVDFNASGLASGVYFYRIVTDQTVMSKQMVLMK